MTKYICDKCEYSTKLENLGDCPCCKEGKMETEKDANELIEEVEEILND